MSGATRFLTQSQRLILAAGSAMEEAVLVLTTTAAEVDSIAEGRVETVEEEEEETVGKLLWSNHLTTQKALTCSFLTTTTTYPRT